MRPLDLANVADERERRTRIPSTVRQDAEVGELIERIDRSLPVELRDAWLRMRAGTSVPKARRLRVEQAVREILGVDLACQNADD